MLKHVYNDRLAREVKVAAQWEYTNDQGETRYLKTRDEHGALAFWHKGNGRALKAGRGCAALPYALHQLAALPTDEPVFIATNEEEADALRSVGLAATCPDQPEPGGDESVTWGGRFLGRDVVAILPRAAGGAAFEGFLRRNVATQAKTFAVVHLPGLRPDEGVKDWLSKKGNGRVQLRDLVAGKIWESVQGNGHVLPNDVPAVIRGDAWEGEPEEDDDQAGDGWQPFPTECLPVAVADFVNAGGKSMQIDPAFFALHALAALGGVVGNSREMWLKDDWQEPSVFWCCIVAESSSLKTPAWKKATAPLKAITSKLIDENEAAERDHKQRVYDFCQDLSEKGEKGEAKRHPDFPEEINPRQLVVKDITTESLIEVLSHNPNGLILSMDELKGWLGSFGRYQSGKAASPDEAFWLSATGATEHMSNRRNKERRFVYVPRCSVSVCGTIQPDTLKGFATKSFFETGFAARILFAMPPEIVRDWQEDSIPREVYERYADLVDTVWFLSRATFEAGQGEPAPVHMNAAAKKRFVRFYRDWQRLKAESSGYKKFNLGKLEGYCGRFALLLAVCEAAEKKLQKIEVGAAVMDSAIKLTKWFAHEIERVYLRLSKSESAVEQDRVLALVAARGKQIKPKELYFSNKAKYQSVEGARAVLESYVARKLLTRHTDFEKAGRGRKPTVYRL